MQLLHRASLEMIVAERTIEIVGLEDDNLAFVIAKLVGLTIDVLGREIWRGLADFSRCPCGADSCKDGEQCNCASHNFLS